MDFIIEIRSSVEHYITVLAYQPSSQVLLHTRAVSLRDGLLVIGISVALFVVIEAEKQIRLRLMRHKPHAIWAERVR